ncbi:DUF2968 domain-containing protein [Candidatus Burkholderia verschuerenii]|uniref:DUF2968 domain-containing protein n=1 Tax=Candidatus Burkholderia verschuerenii TaxID=242163 RepID=UPI003F7D8856
MARRENAGRCARRIGLRSVRAQEFRSGVGRNSSRAASGADRAARSRVAVSANRLSADLALAQQQDAQVSERQQKLQAESMALASDKAEAERKLRVLQQQVDQLQRQSEAGLTPVAPSSVR